MEGFKQKIWVLGLQNNLALLALEGQGSFLFATPMCLCQQLLTAPLCSPVCLTSPRERLYDEEPPTWREYRSVGWLSAVWPLLFDLTDFLFASHP